MVKTLVKKIRPFGQITDDLEPLIQEMANDHKMQWGEILAIIYGYLMVHCEENREVYEDNTNPKYYYGS